jgi:hypothetical protein
VNHALHALHAMTAANITIVAIAMIGMMFAPDFPGRFSSDQRYFAFMAAVWICAAVGWSMVIS